MPIVLDDSSAAIGAIQSAILTEAQFQSQFGAGWVLADGRSVTGSKYHSLTANTVIPDLRGVVLRGRNNGRSDGNQNPAGELTLGTFQNDALQGHKHQFTTINDDFNSSGGNPPGFAADSAGSRTWDVTNPLTSTYGSVRVDVETRSKNVTVNHFIRIN